MKVKLLVNHRVLFAKGAEIEVDEREGKNLLALGFAEGITEETPKEESEEVPEEKPKAVKPKEKPKAGRPKKSKE